MVDPREDFEINIRGTLNLLDAVRLKGEGAPVIFASTNKVYGDLADLEFRLQGEKYVAVDPLVASSGIGEHRPLDFHTPYGCSKGAADQYVLDYARSFGMRTAVVRMSCIYGVRQMGTEDQGWVAHFLIRALEGKKITLYGDGFQVRDILDVSNAVEAYLKAWERIDRINGRAFNLGGGPANAVSLRELLAHISGLLGREVEVEYSDWRAGDQRYFVADTRAINRELDLSPAVPWKEGVANLLEWLRESRGLDHPLGSGHPVPAAELDSRFRGSDGVEVRA
jgi:CDP-paratose 2-epimerase